jgi:DNA mismatch repair protein MutH
MNPNKAIVVCVAVMVAAIAVPVWESHTRAKEERVFSYFCAGNKGVAVRDLEDKMRCVPMFSAAKVAS